MYERALLQRVQFYQFYDWVLKDIEEAKYSLDDLSEFQKTPRGKHPQPFRILTQDKTPRGSPNMEVMMQSDDFYDQENSQNFKEVEFNLQ